MSSVFVFAVSNRLLASVVRPLAGHREATLQTQVLLERPLRGAARAAGVRRNTYGAVIIHVRMFADFTAAVRRCNN
jgi:hypothetical protein